MDLVSTFIGMAGLALAISEHLRARRAETAATRHALSDAGASIAGELTVLSVLAEEAVVGGRVAGSGGAQRSASLARLCVSCERAEDLEGALRGDGGLPDGAAAHLDGLIADADRALREAERGEVPAPGLAPWRAEKLAAVLRAARPRAIARCGGRRCFSGRPRKGDRRLLLLSVPRMARSALLRGR